MKVAILLLCLLGMSAVAQADNYAVLVAGSDGFWNYRHQSDICHAYQLLLSKGFNPANIILLSYDDVAASPQNPFPGKLYNKPAPTSEGVDVYAGCKIDYRGKDVTPEVFLAVLTGNKTAVAGKGNERVLESTKKDRVFINFSDHGAPNLIAFPSAYLYADKLLAAFATMTANKTYHQMVFYLEACESGSMFLKLPKNTNIYAVSAANPTESSWATYCSPNDNINGKHVGSCLGDEFSVAWMEDSEAANTNTETLVDQWQAVATKTQMSDVMQWGDLTFQKEPVGNFIGNGKKASEGASAGFLPLEIRKLVQKKSDSNKVDSRDVKMQYLVNRFNANPTEQNAKELQQEISIVAQMNSVFQQFSGMTGLNGSAPADIDFDCYRAAITAFENACGRMPESSYRNFKYLAEYCEVRPMMRNYDLVGIFNGFCQNPQY